MSPDAYFECSFEDGRVAQSKLSFTSAQGGLKGICTRERIIMTDPGDEDAKN